MVSISSDFRSVNIINCDKNDLKVRVTPEHNAQNGTFDFLYVQYQREYTEANTISLNDEIKNVNQIPNAMLPIYL